MENKKKEENETSESECGEKKKERNENEKSSYKSWIKKESWKSPESREHIPSESW